MADIKLIQISTLSDGTIRLQSQLPFLNKHTTADFLLKDGKLFEFGKGKDNNKSLNFYPSDTEYILVENKEDMNSQEL